MHIYYLILLLLQFIIQIQAQQLQDGVTTTLYNTFSNNMTTKVMDDIRTTVIMLTATATSTIATTSNANNNSTTKTASLPFFSPSPTSFVYTHFPIFPLHTGSSSSVMSSARPSQSAPFPDELENTVDCIYQKHHIERSFLGCTLVVFFLV